MKKMRKIEVPEKQAESRKLKVAAYCRVSTKYESQKSSMICRYNIIQNILRSRLIGNLQEFLWIMAADAELRAERIFKQ